MARSNPERRRTLLDAAIDVLADEGARGLTFRAVDVRAAVPAGTTSNYFASRDALLQQAGEHIYGRFAPGPEQEAAYAQAPPDRETIRASMHELLKRVAADRNGYLALLELRLEATRRPHLRATLTTTTAANLEADRRRHTDGGFPGDEHTAMILYLAMSGLIVEQLTLPGAWDGVEVDRLVDNICDRVVPDR
ncbi:TetR family transcriptional regulator [Phytomonospora sp. NPDC050363]|uniref:TetR/AcrR family transcriptional regulator n=1 Tax=Phytomonospora sp. NPDC050363 TaxID=3155642 RepID=UPI0033FBFD9E